MKDALFAPELPRTVRIGTGAYHQLDCHRVTNEMLLGTIKTHSDNPIDSGFIVKRTGVLERFHVPGEKATAQMGKAALSEALESKGWYIDDLDYLIVVTSWDTTNTLAEKIYQLQNPDGQKPENLTFLHVYAACTGFAQTLHELNEKKEIFEGKKIAIVATEQYSPHVEGLDTAIFGDNSAAFAGVFGTGPDADFQILASTSKTFEEQKHFLRMRVHSPKELDNVLFFQDLPHPDNLEEVDFIMDGSKVFEYSVDWQNYAAIELTLIKAGTELKEVNAVYMHQANERIRKNREARLRNKGFKGKISSNIERFGNTSSASIPLLIDEAVKNGDILPEHTALLWGFGAGLMSTVVLVKFK